ncbi:MAG: hypothetical protein PUI72_09445 [Prevotellaceae bacterium]|nr:hypothetical protein [Prevotellaceae bacterium]MDY6199995.1 hypothetical protein [Prevotella sp.]
MARKLILANKYKIVFLYIVSIDKGVKDPFLTLLSDEDNNGKEAKDE